MSMEACIDSSDYGARKHRQREETTERRMIGKTYLERGKPVVVLVKWGKGGGPRNVLIQRQDGTKVVRPFRGLRKSNAVRGVHVGR